MLLICSSACRTLSFDSSSASLKACWSARTDSSSSSFSPGSSFPRTISAFSTIFWTFSFSASSSDAVCLSWPRASFATRMSLAFSSQLWRDSWIVFTRLTLSFTSSWIFPISAIHATSCSCLIKASVFSACNSFLIFISFSRNGSLWFSHALETWLPAASRDRICSSISWHFSCCFLCRSSWALDFSAIAEHVHSSSTDRLSSVKDCLHCVAHAL